MLANSLLLAQAPQTSEQEKLVAVGKLWVTIKYFHPYLAYRDIDWDQALVRALPAIRAASSTSEYETALNGMLGMLGDPGTYAHPDTPPKAAAIRIERGTDGTLRVSSDSSGVSSSAVDQTAELVSALEKTRNVVFDLRASSDMLSQMLDQPPVARMLIAGGLDLPGERTWVHGAIPSATQPISSFYSSTFATKADVHIEGESKVNRRMEFLLAEGSRLPAVACSLIAAGQASVRAEGVHYRVGREVIVSMGSGISVSIALSEPVFLDGTGFSLSNTHKALPAFPSSRPESSYSEMRYPATEYRILAAYKIWGAIHYFFAYRDQMDEDWDQVFEEYLPKLAGADSARDYNLTVAEMITHLADSNAEVHSEELADYFGRAPIGLRLRLIDKKPIVTEVLDAEARKAGVAPGDMVTKVDRENMAERINREARYMAASTQQSLRHMVVTRVLNGVDGSRAVLTIVGKDGVAKEISFDRSSTYSSSLRNPRAGEVYRVLPGNIGYADLDRLMPADVDAMFEKLWGTEAIVFDMRGHSSVTAWSVASRLVNSTDVPAAIFNGPLALTPDISQGDAVSQTASYFFVQTISLGDKPTYKGKTVMLIDESTMGEAEHAGLLLEAANKTDFIGTPSAGADGGVSSFIVPGGITIEFSGQDVRHANGGQLQRLGLQPVVTVSPTASGIRAGRDEVLDEALEYLRAGSQKGRSGTLRKVVESRQEKEASKGAESKRQAF